VFFIKRYKTVTKERVFAKQFASEATIKYRSHIDNRPLYTKHDINIMTERRSLLPSTCSCAIFSKKIYYI